ncbi:hypothetical protein NQZ68_035163, partial [Dissostichus eleginoides]
SCCMIGPVGVLEVQGVPSPTHSHQEQMALVGLGSPRHRRHHVLLPVLWGLPSTEPGFRAVAKSPSETVSLAAWLPGCLAAWLTGCLAAWLTGCLAAWLPGCLAAWCFSRLYLRKQKPLEEKDPINREE